MEPMSILFCYMPLRMSVLFCYMPLRSQVCLSCYFYGEKYEVFFFNIEYFLIASAKDFFFETLELSNISVVNFHNVPKIH